MRSLPHAAAKWATVMPTLVTLLLKAPAFQSRYEAAIRRDVPFQRQVVLACLISLECGTQQLDAGAAGSADGGRQDGTPVAAALREQVGAEAAADALGTGSGWLAVCRALTLLSMKPVATGLSAVAHGPTSARLLDCASAALRHLVSPAAEQQLAGQTQAATASAALSLVAAGHAAQVDAPGRSTSDLCRSARKVLRLLPDAIAARRLAAAAEGGSTDGLAALATVNITSLAGPRLLQHVRPAEMSAADVVAWCTAAVAALRVLPLLLQLQPRLRGVNLAAEVPDATSLLDSLPGHLLGVVASQLQPVNQFNVQLTCTAEGQAEAVETQAEPLFLLHSVAVRCLHWLCTLDDAQLAAMPVLATWDGCALGGCG